MKPLFSHRMPAADDPRPELRFDAIILPVPPGWDGWGRLRVTAVNHADAAADLVQICRSLRLGGRIVTLSEAGVLDPATLEEVWPPVPRGGRHRCADLREHRVPASRADAPGTASFEVLIHPGRGLGKLGYRLDYAWADAPHQPITGRIWP